MAEDPRHSMRFHALAEPGAVRELREELGRFLTALGVDEATAFDIKLAVTEATNNVLTHAYRERRSAGPLLVEAHVAPEGLRVTIVDEGGGPAPRSDSPGAGLGMPLMATLADDLVVRRRDDGGTRVEMAFEGLRAS
jgi:anti-sigma regulatory factor (Ser/Thr protein kinase)